MDQSPSVQARRCKNLVRRTGRLVLAVVLSGALPARAAPVDRGDTYVDASIGDASVLNPILAKDSASNDINNLVFNGLVKYDKDLRIVGDLAERYEVRRGGLELIFHLRRHVRWHDGQPFTADDVLFTFEKLRDPATLTAYGDNFVDVDRVEALDAHTVRVIYKRAFSPGLISWGMGMVPKHLFAGQDFNAHPANRRPIGTGPFRFKEWKSDQVIVLEANPDYFEGRPPLDRYVYRIIPDQAVQFLELRNQSIDAMTLTPDQFKAYDAIFEHHRRFRYPAFKYVYLGFNLRRPLFQDLRVRRAIALATDRETLVKGILLGLGQPISGPFAVSSWAYNTDVKPPPYDVDEARRLLAEAGWRPGPDGILEKNGQRFSFELSTNQGNKVRALCAEIIQRQLAAVGIDVRLRIIEWAVFQDKYIDKRNFDALVMGWSTGLDPDHFGIWHSSQQKEGQHNFVSYSNPEVDRLLIAGRREFDPARRRAIYRQIHALIAQDLPYVFLYCPDELLAVHNRIQGPEVAPAGIGWNFREWWVPKDRQRYRAEMLR